MSSLAYRYTAELTFVGADGEQKIDPLFIRHLVVENLYIDRSMPIIYISLALTPELYEDVIESESVATFFFSLNCYNAYSNNPVSSGSFSGIFNYVVSTNNPSYDTPLSRQSQSPDGNYRSLTIALMGVNQLNASRAEKDVNDGILVSGVFGKVDTNTLIGKIINGFEKYNLTSILKAPEYNNQFEELIIPPMNNRQDIMQFVFDKAPFYDTPFTFYLDFHNAYLLAASETDEGYFVEDGSGINNIIFDAKNITKSDSYEEGMDIDGDSIVVHVNPSHMSIFPNKVQDKVANNLVTIDEAGNLDAKELQVNSNENSDPKYTFKRGGKAQLYQNILESNLVQIIVSKEGLNSSMFTPNKKYFIKNHVGTSDYNGAYMLIEKKDIIRSNNGVMRSSTEFTLRKIGNIGKIGETIINSRNVRNSSRAKSSTTASTSSPTTRPAGGSAASTSQTNSNTRVASTETTTRKIIPKTNERSTGGVQFISDYDPSYSVTQPAIMGVAYTKSDVESEQVQELSEEEWLARTSIRGSAAIIDISNAGPTRIINDKSGGTLNKPLFG